MLVDALHLQMNRFSGSVQIVLPFRFAGVAQVAIAGGRSAVGILRRKAGSQKSSQSQLKGLL